MSDLYSYMGMAKVVAGPDGTPIQLTGSNFEMGEVAKQIGIVGLSAAMMLPVPGVINSIHAQAEAGYAVVTRKIHKNILASERIVFCRTWLSLSMTQLASALRLERQTIYGWVSGSSTPHDENEQRLNTVFTIAVNWQRFANEPLGKAVTRKLSNGKSLHEMLIASDLNVFEIRNLFAELKPLLAEKTRGQERRQLAESLGYESASREDAADQLRTNLPI